MFRLLVSHLQAYSLQLSDRMLCTYWDPSVFTSAKSVKHVAYVITLCNTNSCADVRY
jgi:hypothetical protein